jgi:biopolymer transport protein ExbD
MRTIVAGLFLFTFMITPAWAQSAPIHLPQAAGQGHPPGAPPPTPAEIEIQKRMARQRNQERFAQLKKETDQLLELATQLKKSVDEASDRTLSLEVIRKAEQIEKLAKQIRHKMVGE